MQLVTACLIVVAKLCGFHVFTTLDGRPFVLIPKGDVRSRAIFLDEV